LYGKELAATDEGKFKAAKGKERDFSEAKSRERADRLEVHIEGRLKGGGEGWGESPAG
jgi:hypothetical protein